MKELVPGTGTTNAPSPLNEWSRLPFCSNRTRAGTKSPFFSVSVTITALPFPSTVISSKMSVPPNRSTVTFPSPPPNVVSSCPPGR